MLGMYQEADIAAQKCIYYILFGVQRVMVIFDSCSKPFTEQSPVSFSSQGNHVAH